MNQNDSQLVALRKEFGARLVTLNGGGSGIRAGLKCDITKTGPRTFRFVASDATLDRYNEVIEQGGWDLKNYRANPVVPDCHNYDSVARILGRSVNVEVKDGQLINDVEFCTDNPLGNMAMKMTEGGFIKSESVGFIPLEWNSGKSDKEPERTYTKAELLEISLVVVPANPGATVGLALKSGALARADIRAVVEHLKQFCSEEPPQSPLARATGDEAWVARLLTAAKSALR